MTFLFTLPMMKAIEVAFNNYVSLDPDSSPYIKPLVGKVVQIDVAGLALRVVLVFNEQRVEVCDEFGAEADVVIRGAPVSLAAVASGRTGLMQSGVIIEGEIETAKRFSKLLERIDIDWEEQVATIAGDQSAHALGRLRDGTSRWVHQFQAGMERNVAAYLRDETRYLPHQWEIDEFIDDVDNLRDRVDRLLEKVRAMSDRRS